MPSHAEIAVFSNGVSFFMHLFFVGETKEDMGCKTIIEERGQQYSLINFIYYLPLNVFTLINFIDQGNCI